MSDIQEKDIEKKLEDPDISFFKCGEVVSPTDRAGVSSSENGSVHSTPIPDSSHSERDSHLSSQYNFSSNRSLV